ncbi:MAG: glycoside hydrolase family 43 protein [Chthoniobacteraceae bacterium]
MPPLRFLFTLLFFGVSTLTSLSSCEAGGGFLFVTFKGEKDAMGEQIYFGLSRDGLAWEVLNRSQPVLVSDQGEKGARDPYLLRSHDGKTFYILATDLSMFHNRNWGRAARQGSRSLLIWESRNLVQWSKARLVKLAPDDAGCLWAPEAIFDDETGDYLIYWASTTGRDQFSKQRIWAARTRDFQTFSQPFIYIEKPTTIIDTDIVRAEGKYYRFTKDEHFRAITMEVGDKLSGPWRDVPGFSLAQLRNYEGPACFQIKPADAAQPATWCLLLDQCANGYGYHPFISSSLAEGQFTPETGVSFPFLFRHGSILPVNEEEYTRLKTAFPSE